MRAAGYDAWASIEVFDFTPDPPTIAQRGLAYLRQAYAEAMGHEFGGQ